MKQKSYYAMLLAVVLLDILFLAYLFIHQMSSHLSAHHLSTQLATNTAELAPVFVNVSAMKPSGNQFLPKTNIPFREDTKAPPAIQQNISKPEAISIARTEKSGDIRSVTIMTYNHVPVYAVEFGTAADSTDVYVAMNNGTILGIASE